MDKKKMGLWVAGLPVGGVVLLTVAGACLPEPTATEDASDPASERSVVENVVAPEDDAPASLAAAPPEPTYDPRLRDAVQDVISALRNLDAPQAAADLARSAHELDPELTRDAWLASAGAYSASRAYARYLTEREAAEEAQWNVNDEARRLYERADNTKPLHTLAFELMQGYQSVISRSREERDRYEGAVQDARTAWMALEPLTRDSSHIYHDEAATASERAAGMQPGAFGEIDEVYYWFLRRTQRVTPLDPPLEQKRTFDYGAAMLKYFELDPVGEHQDKYDEWRRVVESRLETLGWMNGTPKFERLRH